MNRRHTQIMSAFLTAIIFLILSAPATEARRAKKKAVGLEIAKIYFEFNSSANDLGVHVFLDGEDWKEIAIVNPEQRTIFEVEGKGPYTELGMTELFFEGAEPSLDEFPLDELLALFPEGKYKFIGKTVDGQRIMSTAMLSHAIPAGPSNVSAMEINNSLVISWDPVAAPPLGFPDKPIIIVSYQVIVEREDGLRFDVTVPATVSQVTVPPQFLETGMYKFEVLAIDESGNQTITEGTFVL